MANNSRKLRKSDGTQIDADLILTPDPYPSGSFQYFSETQPINSNATGLLNNQMVLYPIYIRNSVTVDRIMAVVTGNGTPTAGAKFHAVAYTYVNETTLSFYANLGEFDATLVGTATTNVQALTINQYFPAGVYYIGFQHNNSSSIGMFGHSISSYVNVGAIESLTNMSGVNVKVASGSYSYPKSAGNITVVSSSSNNVAVFKFRIV